jgi:hypothetical protein
LKIADSIIKRQNFHRETVVLSATLLYLLILVNALTAPALAQEKPVNFYFVANSTTMLEGVRHIVAVSGTGVISGSEVVGGGAFAHFLFNISAATGKPGPPPYQLVDSGTWNATRLVSFKMLGTYGLLAAGRLEMDVNLYRQVPTSAVTPGSITEICNLKPAKLINFGSDGQPLPEGLIITIPGTDFVTGGKAGPFAPFVPANGVTVFTTGTEVVTSLQNAVREKDMQISSLNAQVASLNAQLSQAQQARQLTYALGGLAALFLITTIVLAVRKKKA